MKILNLTQHLATSEQLAAGVINLSDVDRAILAKLLTFDECPTETTLIVRAESIAKIAVNHPSGVRNALIGGAPYFMRPLETALWQVGIRPLYAFSKRVSEERMQENGHVEKINVFRHAGFVGLVLWTLKP